MCHLLLSLPLLALPVFWILPLPSALLVYGAVTAISMLVYWYALQAMNRPVVTGMEGMIGETGTVVEACGTDLRIQVHNELWYATTDGTPVRDGDQVEVVGADCRTLKVRRLDPGERFFGRSETARSP